MTCLAVFVLRDKALMGHDIAGTSALAWCARRAAAAHGVDVTLWMPTFDLEKPLRAELERAGDLEHSAFRAIQNRQIARGKLRSQETLKAIQTEAASHFGASRFKQLLIVEPRYPLLPTGFYDTLLEAASDRLAVAGVELEADLVASADGDEQPGHGRRVVSYLKGLCAAPASPEAWKKVTHLKVPRWQWHDLGDPSDRIVIDSLATTGDIEA